MEDVALFWSFAFVYRLFCRFRAAVSAGALKSAPRRFLCRRNTPACSEAGLHNGSTQYNGSSVELDAPRHAKGIAATRPYMAASV
mmetsp:Transcript_57659/g.151742  ORF Transcript_57659/g.151742 Transcript_57659/m.151742 type:complete len:85 (+) Transcript_57659:1437-1691(+)